MDNFNVNLDSLPDELPYDELYNKGKDEDGNLEISDKLYKSFQENISKVISKIEECGIPKKGQQLRLITTKSFNSVAFIELIAINEIINELLLVIFSINISAAKRIIELKNRGRIKEIKIIVSSIRNAGHKLKSKAVKLLLESGLRIVFVNSHAKIMAIRTNQNYYVIEGSGNMSFNGRIEQYIIDNDKALYFFTKNWMKEIEIIMKDDSVFTIMKKEYGDL